MPEDGAVPDAVRAVWQHLGETWDDAARHDAFVALVVEYGCYAWAVARYRQRAGDPIADRQLERLREVATEKLMPRPTGRRPPPARRFGVFGMLGVMFASLCVVGALGYAYASCHSAELQVTPAPRGEWKR